MLGERSLFSKIVPFILVCVGMWVTADALLKSVALGYYSILDYALGGVIIALSLSNALWYLPKLLSNDAA